MYKSNLNNIFTLYMEKYIKKHINILHYNGIDMQFPEIEEEGSGAHSHVLR